MNSNLVLRGGGARANQFKVTLPFPGYASVGGETSDLAFLCSATALPGQTVGQCCDTILEEEYLISLGIELLNLGQLRY